MLRTDLPMVPKARETSSQTGSEASSQTGSEATSTTASTSTPTRLQVVTQSRRFYSSLDGGTRASSPGSIRSAASEDEDSESDLELTRRGAVQTLNLCSHVITTLELTRLRKSRTGLFYWTAFWERLYERQFARTLASRVSSALAKVDTLFRAVSTDLHQLTQGMIHAATVASSDKEILHILERMEDEVGVRRRRRRRRAQAILNKMRSSIETIPVKVSDDLFDDMKRGIFALDVFCDYHPGDPVAEAHEATWSEFFAVHQTTGRTAVSPYLYRQWQQSGTSGAYPPLEAYTSNNLYVGYAEDWVNAPSEHGYDPTHVI
ncbi:uncharacterized protein BDW47DRAFT_132169 [Aspergillus candidus]|uniref:Uncharacterized protein n=1 Tax=Aspergillus candidus TaxID=41067 RepID=A0A2I2F975_ASPCN|nr:hypothetical protein BDW47DRAFT_132169 [Aspergillus candidus]PLB37171.1 hypothetical protein BDW47DRAFT_132169 [Aspergillus candidus]